MLRLIFALPLIAHGLAHLSGVFAPWTAGGAGFTDRPWVLPGSVSLHSGAGRAFSPAWLVASICLVGAGVSLLLSQPWWSALALAGALVSLVIIVSWWNTVPPGARIGAVFDLLVLAALLHPLVNAL